MDQYFNQMDKIIKERKTSSRIRFMLQDVIDLRRVNIDSSVKADRSKELKTEFVVVTNVEERIV